MTNNGWHGQSSETNTRKGISCNIGLSAPLCSSPCKERMSRKVVHDTSTVVCSRTVAALFKRLLNYLSCLH
eukprot:scaffold25085_cov15-Tisochrysis_lutea.AAC.2